jgi:hypothetical protein
MTTEVVSLTLQDIQANATQTVNVGVVDLGQEADFGRSHRIVVGQEELEAEDATWGRPISLQLTGRYWDYARIPSYGDCAGP